MALGPSGGLGGRAGRVDSENSEPSSLPWLLGIPKWKMTLRKVEALCVCLPQAWRGHVPMERGWSGVLCESNVTEMCLCQETYARSHVTRWQNDVCPSVTKATFTQPSLCQGLLCPCACEELCLMVWPHRGVYVRSLRMWVCVFVQKTCCLPCKCPYCLSLLVSL